MDGQKNITLLKDW